MWSSAKKLAMLVPEQSSSLNAVGCPGFFWLFNSVADSVPLVSLWFIVTMFGPFQISHDYFSAIYNIWQREI